MRRFLSILLVVFLLFSLLAVPASAMSAGAVVASYGGLEAVSAIISGLGITIDSLEKFDAWNTLVSSASEYLTAQNIIDAVGTIATLKSGSKIYFPSSVVQSVKDYLFSSDKIQTVSSISSSGTFVFDGITFNVLSCEAPVYYGYFLTLQSINSSDYNCSFRK